MASFALIMRAETSDTIGKARNWPFRSGLKDKEVSGSIALVLSSGLLNAQHFAEDKAWRRDRDL